MLPRDVVADGLQQLAVDGQRRLGGDEQVVELEALSTALMVTLENASSDTQARMKRLLELKPHLKETLASEAIQELDALRHEASELIGV